MLERDMQNDLDDLEKDAEGNIDPDKAVKKYRRSAAGGEQPLPSDVRTPAALNKTLDYLVDNILANNSIDKCHKFVRDRTRSIRQDFTLQNIRDLDAVATHERIARFHILSLHEMCEYDEGTFSLPQEMEQLHKTLISLMEFYDDLRDRGIETENEAEFRAYHIISQIKDEDIAQRSMRLPVYIFKSQYITRALKFRALSQRNNEILESSSRRNKPENIEACQNFYSYFFKLIADPGTSFLMACLLETHFSEVRKGALKAMNASYMMKAGGVQAEHVRQVLAYDTIKQLFKEAMLYGIVIDNSLGEPTLSFGQKHYSKKLLVFKEPLSNPSQRKSFLLVEPKKAGRTFRDIVNG
ncbi:SAC3/GANP/Nin1/mts3/eIF-3 p25 family-domain-containing protein, partial [Thamnidium elegans]